MEELKVNVQAVGNEVIIRTGDAPIIQEPKQYTVTGSVNSASEYLAKRGSLLDASKVSIELNEESGTVTVRRDPNDPIADVIVGKFQSNPLLDNFGINGNKKYSREELVKLVKFNRVFFDSDENSQLLVQLSAFQAKVNASINQSSDNRGNKTDNFAKKVEAEISMGFKMKIPVFRGEIESSFWVDIAFDITDGGVKFWLESVELAEIKQRIVADTMDKFNKAFGDNYVIFRQ